MWAQAMIVTAPTSDSCVQDYRSESVCMFLSFKGIGKKFLKQ